MATHNKHAKFSSTMLRLDLFGLGPAEVAVIAGLAVVLFGPEKFGKSFGVTKTKTGTSVPAWMLERQERIDEMKEIADAARLRRAKRRAQNEKK